MAVNIITWLTRTLGFCYSWYSKRPRRGKPITQYPAHNATGWKNRDNAKWHRFFCHWFYAGYMVLYVSSLEEYGFRTIINNRLSTNDSRARIDFSENLNFHKKFLYKKIKNNMFFILIVYKDISTVYLSIIVVILTCRVIPYNISMFYKGNFKKQFNTTIIISIMLPLQPNRNSNNKR